MKFEHIVSVGKIHFPTENVYAPPPEHWLRYVCKLELEYRLETNGNQQIANNKCLYAKKKIPVDSSGVQPVDIISFSFRFIPPLCGPQCLLHTTFGIDARFVESNNRCVNRERVLFGKHSKHFGCRANSRCSKFSIQSVTTHHTHTPLHAGQTKEFSE